jgi:hypothetical protein
LHLCCYASGDGWKLILELLDIFFIISPQVKRVPHALGRAMHAWKGGLGIETLPTAPNSSGGLKSFLSMNSWFYMNFDSPEHSLEGSSLNSCTCVVMLVVMVASSYLSYVIFFLSFLLKWSVFLMLWEGLCMLGKGDSVPRLSQRPPILAVDGNHFDP